MVIMEIKENVNNVDEFNKLYDEVGWGSYDISISKKALDNTFYSISIYMNDECVGFGRMIGDSICFLYICDIMVSPKYQGHGIGTKIMDALIKKISDIKNDNPSLRVYLGASPGRENFYKKFGFITREEAKLGSGMVLL